MKTKIICCTLLVLLVGLLRVVPAQTSGQPSSASVSEAARAAGPTLSVTVTAEGWSGEVASYTSGKNFVVVVPQARADAITWNLLGHGLAGIRIEQHGDDCAVVLQVESAQKPTVRQNGKTIEILFLADNSPALSSPPETSAAMLTTAAPTTTATAANHPIAPVLNTAAQQTLKDAVLKFLPGKATANSLNLNLLVPESPAFAVLGFTPQAVIRPATPQQFATSLINGLDQNGNFQNGIALDTAPYMLINGENVTIKQYMDNYMTRLLSRAQFSFAVTKGASKDDLTTRLAGGFNLTLWDRGDPRIYRKDDPDDVLNCFVRTLKFDTPIPPDVDPDNQEQLAAFVAPELARLKTLADECRAKGAKAKWNRSAWTIAYAPSWISKTGKSSDFNWDGGALWTSLAYGFERFPALRKTSQIIFHARYRSREQVPDETTPTKTLTQNTFFFGARFRTGGPKFALNFEDAFLRTRTLGGGVDSSNRFAFGTEVRLSDNLYFVISAGGNAARADGRSKGFVLTSFKYGFNKQPQLGTPQ